MPPTAADRAHAQLLYHQLQLAAAHLKRVADERCRNAVGVSAAQAGALFVIEQQPGSTQRLIASRLRVRESAVKTMVDRLENLELVDRRPNDEDARAWQVHLTARGTDVLTGVRRELDRVNLALGRIVGEDVERLAEVLSQITEFDFDAM